MATLIEVILSDAMKLLVVILGLIYAGLVFTGYITEGPHYQPRLHWTEPARSGERLLVWTGIKILHAFLRLFRSACNQLFTASAEVGLWVVDKSGRDIQRKVHSRFL
ncbi:MAG TPA: hypothetical protein VKW70_02590 [Terriglobia bacterium]|nr:hypothetical protein [Terriglobia bacterium]